MALLTEDQLYQRPREIERSMTPFSCGEYILRSAATVEQTFGGLTTRLWDDPFEWTLPEKLTNIASVINYLDEVAVTRKKGLEFLTSDEDLLKQLPSPERIRPIGTILIETIASASHYQGRAFAVFQILSDQTLPRL
nr:hypothetical protein [uncultured bacterium]